MKMTLLEDDVFFEVSLDQCSREGHSGKGVLWDE